MKDDGICGRLGGAWQRANFCQDIEGLECPSLLESISGRKCSTQNIVLKFYSVSRFQKYISMNRSIARPPG